jgi:O-antigen ligase
MRPFCNPEGGAVSAGRTLIEKLTGCALVAAGFAIPLSTTLSGILGALLMLLWIADGDFKSKFQIIRANPVALASLVLFGLYNLGLLYGKPSERVVFDVSHFLLLALTIPLFGNSRVRPYAIWGFLSAMLFMLVLSYLAWFSLLPPLDYLDLKPGNPLVIQDRITYGFFMTMAAFFFAVNAYFVPLASRKGMLVIFAALSVFNCYMVNNKTAFLILMILAGYFLINQWRWKGACVFFIAFALLGAVTYYHPNSTLHDRIVVAANQFKQWQPDKADLKSVGQRMEFYLNSIRIIKDHPFFGVGIGGFAEAYAKQVKDPGMELTDNPHNEYLLMAVQLGLLGLAALLYLFYTQWRLAPLLPTPKETILARGVILAFVVGCLFNSFLTDYDEGVFFVWISALLFSGLNPVRKDDPENVNNAILSHK